ncbi:hypothetical protein Catovirus_1_510 [Catovirus CTV1]|uniref:Uncharacterized protein n=1 Tax=Catovirus CTV1 TaxID=1977631 RepID=A0A1V0S9S3_9VIRU|nr:hypothetical protein Catovirus_1_510 [Catovirus CTV1]
MKHNINVDCINNIIKTFGFDYFQSLIMVYSDIVKS